ncbi:Oidioi.mRNA.OKI2018_I69.chr2.g5108.t1.cds [Oikopleura dioica]|uniref:Oidioi.mRNA.OKI2018_I69.chr2.g5108.t1.cds n=1 Tax=Oikopleura dioica TaxID=34765 RepID=A0ABN7SZ53_OIKDI|nr:Oidioi.mRNA.OKI2018_I69.chr2.g5108.t1.cds [Oikopleura dioica]
MSRSRHSTKKFAEQTEENVLLEWREGVTLDKYFIIIYKEYGNYEYEYLNEQAVEKPFANVVGLEPNTFYKFGLYGTNGTAATRGATSWIVARTLGETVRQFPGTLYPDNSGFASLVVLPDSLDDWWDQCAYVLTIDLQCPIKSIDFDVGESVVVIERGEEELVLAFGKMALDSVFRVHKKFHYFVHVDPDHCNITSLEDKFIISRNDDSVGIMNEIITVSEEATWPTEAFYPAETWVRLVSIDLKPYQVSVCPPKILLESSSTLSQNCATSVSLTENELGWNLDFEANYTSGICEANQDRLCETRLFQTHLWQNDFGIGIVENLSCSVRIDFYVEFAVFLF